MWGERKTKHVKLINAHKLLHFSGVSQHDLSFQTTESSQIALNVFKKLGMHDISATISVSADICSFLMFWLSAQ